MNPPPPSRPPSRLRATGRTAWDLFVVASRILGLLAVLLIVLPVALVPLAAAGVILVGVQLVVGSFGGHYRHLLTQRYLRRKLIPLFAAVAVALCTAMVVIVLSVMGGFLGMLRSSGQSLIGDVSIYFGLGGFPHYEEVIQEIEKLPEAEAVTPIIEAFGLLKLFEDDVRGVRVMGIRGEEIDKVTGYRKTLFWNNRKLDKHEFVREVYGPFDPLQAGLKVQLPWPRARENYVPMVPGLEVSPRNFRTDEGEYVFEPSILAQPLTLTILPVSRKGGIDTTTPETVEVIPVNEFTSGVYEVDSKQVFIPFDVAQKMMRMHPRPRILRDANGDEIVDDKGNIRTEGVTPARTSWVYIKAAPGVELAYLRERVREVYQKVYERHDDMPPLYYMGVATWEERQAGFLRAVENEKGLMAFLFSIISIVSVVMVGVIFYTIVAEKTRDIGVLRALGASQAGVASIFLGFGAMIGLIGSVIGCAIGYFFVTYINEVHNWLGGGFSLWAVVLVGTSAGLLVGILAVAGMFGIDALTDRNLVSRHTLRRMLFIVGGCVLVGLVASGVALLASEQLVLWAQENLRIVIWDRKVYFFDRIPSRVDPVELTIIGVVAVIASVVGALLPAVKAAMVDPVESLRYE